MLLKSLLVSIFGDTGHISLLVILHYVHTYINNEDTFKSIQAQGLMFNELFSKTKLAGNVTFYIS